MKRWIHASTEGMTARQRANLARKTTDSQVLRELANDNARSVRVAVLMNTATPQNILNELCAEFIDDADWGVRSAVARKTKDPSIWEELADDVSWRVRQAVAETTDDPEILSGLASDEDGNVRLAVALHTDDPEILEELADDESSTVREAAMDRLG